MSNLVQLTDAEIELVSGGWKHPMKPPAPPAPDIDIAVINQVATNVVVGNGAAFSFQLAAIHQ